MDLTDLAMIIAIASTAITVATARIYERRDAEQLEHLAALADERDALLARIDELEADLDLATWLNAGLAEQSRQRHPARSRGLSVITGGAS